MTDDLAASKVDVKFLVTLAVIFGGVLIGWTANREKVLRNTEEVARLSQKVDATMAELALVSSRVLTIENGILYRTETMEQINAKLNRLLEMEAKPPGDRNGR